MGLSCGAKVLKYCLFAFNLIFLIAGIVCLGIGVWLICDTGAFGHLSDAIETLKKEETLNDAEIQQLNTASIYQIGVILAVGGAVIIVIAFLGCCGAVKEWRPLLVIYAVLLMLILAVELAAIIYAAINRNNLNASLSKIMKKTLKYYNLSADNMRDEGTKAPWDAAMTTFECCGVNSTSRDFSQSGWKKKMGQKFPPACCPLDKDGKLVTVCTEEDRFKDGCFMKIWDSLTSKLGIVIGVAAAVAVIQIVGVIFAFCLCNSISKGYD